MSLLRDKLFHRLTCVARTRDEADFAELRHVPALRAIMPPGRRGPFVEIEFFPIVAEPCQMSATWVERHGKLHEWIDLGADGLRHFFQLDPVITRLRIVPDLLAQLQPNGDETIGCYALREVRRQ